MINDHQLNKLLKLEENIYFFLFFLFFHFHFGHHKSQQFNVYDLVNLVKCRTYFKKTSKDDRSVNMNISEL